MNLPGPRRHHRSPRQPTLGADLGVADASTDDIYAAMDWLADQQDDIEAKLARRHLAPDPNPARMALFDLSSSWPEGTRCELAPGATPATARKPDCRSSGPVDDVHQVAGLKPECRGFEVPVQQLIEGARSTRRFCRACGHGWLPGVEEGDDGQDTLVGVQGGVDVELAEDAVDVLFHRTLRYPQGLGDPGVGLTLGHQLQHLSFS
jgi:hypothetical protein